MTLRSPRAAALDLAAALDRTQASAPPQPVQDALDRAGALLDCCPEAESVVSALIRRLAWIEEQAFDNHRIDYEDGSRTWRGDLTRLAEQHADRAAEEWTASARALMARVEMREAA